jgi:lysophospholipase L1-like esterase
MARAHAKLRLALLVLSLVLCGIGAEIVLRYRCMVCSWTERNYGEYVSPYKAPPGGTWYHVRPPNQVMSYRLPEFDFELRTNSMGIRDVEHPIERAANEFRIIGLGDSFTEGQGAAYEDSYLKVLERNLNDKLDGFHVRIISGGVSGSDPFFCYRLLKDKLIQYDPDLVTLAINSSDVTDIVTRGGHERFRANGTVKFAEPPAVEWLFERSHLYRVLSFNLFDSDWFGLRPSQLRVGHRRSLEKLEMVLDQYQDLTERKGAGFLVILHPDFRELSTRKYSFDVSRLRHHLDENGVNNIDLMEYFLKRMDVESLSPEKLYWQIDSHHNAAGYRILAEGVEEHLLQNRYFELELLE